MSNKGFYSVLIVRKEQNVMQQQLKDKKWNVFSILSLKKPQNTIGRSELQTLVKR